MAVVNTDPNQDQSTMNVLNPQQALQGQMPGGQPAPPILSSAPGGANVGGLSPSTPAGGSSSNFAGLQNFFEGNQDAGGKIANKISSKAGTQASDIGAAVQSKAQEYQQKAQTAQQAIQQGQQANTGVVQGIIQNATPITADQIKQYQDYTAGKNAQGGSLSDIGTLDFARQQAIQQDLARQAQNATTSSGTMDLLRNYFGNSGRSYSPGQQSLDAALIRKSSAAQQGLQSSLNQASTDLSGKLSSAQNAATESQTNINNALRTAQEQLEAERSKAYTGINDDVAAKAKQVYDTRTALTSALTKSGGVLSSLTPEQKNAIGLNLNYSDYWTPNLSAVAADPKNYGLNTSGEVVLARSLARKAADQGTASSIFGVTPTSYFTGLDQQYDENALKGMYMTPDQLARANSLSQLVGQQQNIVANPDDVAKYQGAGLGANYGVGFKQADYLNALDKAATDALGAQFRKQGYDVATPGYKQAEYTKQIADEGDYQQKVKALQALYSQLGLS